MAKKKTVEKALNIDNILFNCRDILRAARNSGSFFEKRDMMLTLVFLRFIGEKYEDGIEKLRQILIDQGLDPDDENIKSAFFDDATFTDGTYNLPVEARWSTIINTPALGLNVALDTALHSIATGSKDLKGCFIEGTFTTRNLASNDIKKLVDEINKISHKAFGEEKDLIGRMEGVSLKPYICSSSYIVFKVNDKKELMPEYLSLLFERSEFNRYSRFNSWGSARETFDWEEMCNVSIPVSNIEIQRDIVNIFEAYNIRKEISEKLKAQIKDICPILIKGSIEEAGKTKEA